MNQLILDKPTLELFKHKENQRKFKIRSNNHKVLYSKGLYKI